MVCDITYYRLDNADNIRIDISHVYSSSFMAKSLNTKPIKKHLESYALVSDAHRTTHRILKEQNETILKMRTILTQFKELPEQYGKRLMSTNETHFQEIQVR